MDYKTTPRAWKDELAKIASWACADTTSDSTDLKFAHIQGPSASGKSTNVPIITWFKTVIKSPDAMVIHAMEDIEVGRVLRIRNDPDSVARLPKMKTVPKWNLFTGSYEALFQVVKANLKRLSSHEDPTTQPPDEQGLLSETLQLAQHVVFMVDLSLYCSAGLAGLLVSLVAWSKPRGLISPGKTIRVLTMSSGSTPVYVTKLARIYSAYPSMVIFDPIRHFCLPADKEPAYMQANVRCVRSTELVSTVDSIIVPPGMCRTMVCFDTHMSDMGLYDCIAKPAYYNYPKPVVAQFVPPKQRDEMLVAISDQIQDGFGTSCSGLHIMPTAWCMNASLRNDRMLDLVISPNVARNVLDYQTGQVACLSLRRSREEILHALSWADRCCLDPSLINIFLVSDQTTDLKSFLEDAAPHWRIDASDSQLTAFIAILADSSLNRWFADPATIVAAFFRNPNNMRWFDMTVRQMHIQKIMQWVEPERTFRWHLPLEVGRSFVDLLPVFGYDARLALLVALPSETPRQTKAKVELASLLYIGWNTIFEFHIGDDFIPTLAPKDIPDAISVVKVLRPLAQASSMWAFVALWEEFFDCPRTNIEILMRGGDTRLYALVPGCISIFKGQVHRLIALIQDVNRCLTDHGVEVVFRYSRLNEPVFTDAECLSVQHDVLRAFLHQLTLVVHDTVQTALDYKSATGLELQIELQRMVDFEELQRLGKPVFGIYYMLTSRNSRDKSRRAISEWSLVPIPVIASWQRATHGQHVKTDLRATLGYQGRFFQNEDGTMEGSRAKNAK